MSEQPMSANPEFLFHYQRLRRDRALMRRQGYVLLIAAGALLAFTIFWASTTSLHRAISPGLFGLFVGLVVLLTCNGFVALHRSRQPIKEHEVTRQRQEERQQLFQFAQGKVSWRYWSSVVVEALVGLIFLAVGLQGAWSLLGHPNTVDLLAMLLSFACLVGAWYFFAMAIRRARTLRRLAAVSSQELATRLSLGEVTEGE